MSSLHRIEKCSLQITLSPKSDLGVVKLLAQEKSRIVDAILAVFDREIPDQYTINLSKIHLDLGTVSRHDFIPKLTERLMALLSAELKHLMDQSTVRALVVTPSVSASMKEPLYNTGAGAWHPDLPVWLFTHLDVPTPWTSFSSNQVLSAVDHYFQTGSFPQAFDFMRTTDLDGLIRYLSDVRTDAFVQTVSKHLGHADFQLRASEHVHYDTLLKMVELVPAVRGSLKKWLAWMERLKHTSSWKYTRPSKLLLLQYLTTPSSREKIKIQQHYIRKAVTIPSGEIRTDPAAPSTPDKATSPPASLGAFVASRSIQHGSFIVLKTFVEKVRNLYEAKRSLFPEEVRHTIFRRYLELIRTHDKGYFTLERLEQLMLPDLQSLPGWKSIWFSTKEARPPAAELTTGPATDYAGVQEDPWATWRNFRAFTYIQFYYRYGYFQESDDLHARDLDTLMHAVLAWDSARLTHYIVPLLNNIDVTARLAETLSTRTIKMMLSASPQVSEALSEWNLWEYVITSLLQKNTYTTVADKFALLQYVGTHAPSMREEIIYEYLLSVFARQALHFTSDLIVTTLRTFDPADNREAAARNRLVDFMPGFAARENNRDGVPESALVGAFRQYLANAGTYVAPIAPDHPLHGRWMSLYARVRHALAAARVPEREDLLRRLLFAYGDFLRLHGTARWTPERFEQYMLREVEHLFASATPLADARLLLAQIDATAASAIIYRMSVLRAMIHRGIRHTVSGIPALQATEALAVFWDTILADTAEVFSFFREEDVPLTFWSELCELLSLNRLHRLLSILAPFQYPSVQATGMLAAHARVREAFYRAFNALQDTQFSLSSRQLVNRIFRPTTIHAPHDNLGTLATPPFPALSPSARILADRILIQLSSAVDAHNTSSARDCWSLLYRFYPDALVPAVRKEWTQPAWRESLALHADLDLLLDITASLWRGDRLYNEWKKFTSSNGLHERQLRALHQFYFDFLARPAPDYDPAAFVDSLRTIIKTQTTSADAATPVEDVQALLTALHTASSRSPATATDLWQSLYARHRMELVQFIRTHHDPEPIHGSLALDAGLYILLDLSALLYQDHTSYSSWVTFTKQRFFDIAWLRRSYHHYFVFLHTTGQGKQMTSSFPVWLDSMVHTLGDFQTRMGDKSWPNAPDESDESTAERGPTLFTPLSGISFRASSARPPLNELRTFLSNTPEAQFPTIPSQPFSATDHTGLAASPYRNEDIILYYLKTGLFIPGTGVSNIAALTTLTTRYFQEVSPDENRIIAAVHESPEVIPRLKLLLSPATLSWLHTREATRIPLPHYTTNRIETVQGVEATLHYWLYGQWPWWYTETRSPEETTAATMENHLGLLIERLTTSRYEVAIVQKIAHQLPQAVFLKMISLRFPPVAGFVTRVFLLLEQLPLEDGAADAPRVSPTTFAVVYDYLAHTRDANPFSARDLFSLLARHEARRIDTSASAWIDRMAALAHAMHQTDSSYWSLYTVLTSLQASATDAEASPAAAAIRDPAGSITLPVSIAPAVVTDGGFTGSAQPSFKEAFVAYLRMGIIPVHTPESGRDKSAFIQQLHEIARHEPAWLTSTLKSLFKNTTALDAYLLRSDPLITGSLIEGLAGSRQPEFTPWRHALENFLHTLPAKSDTSALTTLQTSAILTRTFLLLLLQRPAAKITAIHYAQAVLEYSLHHHLVTGLDVLLDAIQVYKASPRVSEHIAIALEVAHVQLLAQARTALLQSLTSPDKKKKQTAAIPEKGTPILVEGAGVVLMAPFFYMYFNRLGMTENNSFKTHELAVRAVHLLHYLTRGETSVPRHALLYKVLCGVDLLLPLDDHIVLTDHEKEVSESLLQGVLQNWTSLQSKSIDALRETFLQRAGHLEENEMGWHLTVERKSMDILVDWIPWSFSLIKLSWMEKSVAVQWQSDQYRDLMPNTP